MNTTIQKWGNSLALRIPSSVAKDLHLLPGDPVELTLEDGQITIKPPKKRRLSLEHLLKAVTDANRPSLLDWGAPVGNESW